MLKCISLFAWGLAVVGGLLALPCHAQITDPDAKAEFYRAYDPNHPAYESTAEAFLTGQIAGVKATVVGAYAANPGIPAPDPDDYYADSHTKVFENLLTGKTGIFALDQFDPNRTLNNDGTTAITKLQGLLLYFTVQLKSGRQVFDNETPKDISKALLEIGANVHVWCKNDDIRTKVDFSANPYVSKSRKPLKADFCPGDPNDGFPCDITDLTEVNEHCNGEDKLAVIIDPSDPNTSGEVNEILVVLDASHSDLLEAFTGNKTVEFEYTSSLTTHHQIEGQGVIGWSIPPTYDIEARVVYLYSAVPEPTSMSLLAIGVFSVLARRRKKRRTPPG